MAASDALTLAREGVDVAVHYNTDRRGAEQAEQKNPMERAGQQQDTANVALFLASDEAAYVIGSTYFADGGLILNVQRT